jgi:ferrous iron transport protein B
MSVTDTAQVQIPVEQVGITRRARHTVALVGNPNSGKSTLFNRLTGLRQKTANYPGVTVEKHVGNVPLGETTLELIDLPGTYTLSAHSMEERIAVDVVLGHMPGTARPAGILACLSASHLYQGLYLLQQLLQLELPVVVALTMTDLASQKGVAIDVERLSSALGGIKICPVVTTTGQGLAALKAALADLPAMAVPQAPDYWPAVSQAAAELARAGQPALTRLEAERALIDPDSPLSQHAEAALGPAGHAQLAAARRQLFGDQPPMADEARQRYRWIRRVMAEVQLQVPPLKRLGARWLDWLNRPLPATLSFFAVMVLVFQAVFSWATPMMDLIDGASAALAASLAAVLPAGALASLLTDGVIAGVGSVVIFLPQILILFLFLIILEDSGYLARAAFLMDRAMRAAGLSGQSVIPMLASFACAVPGIMATRVIPDRKDRIATIMAAPFMTCSARLPVYALMIAAFVPNTSLGWFNIQGLVLFGLYVLGILGGVLTALLMKGTALRGPTPSFILTLPEFSVPDWRNVGLKLLDRARIFLKRAGTIIFFVALVVWALAYFPRSPAIAEDLAAAQAQAAVNLAGAALDTELTRLENQAASAQLAQSWLGRAGQAAEPLFAPLGWDWRVTAAVIAGFPAREVVVAVLGTVYAVGDESDEQTLAARLRSARWPDGELVFTLPMVLGLLVFYALCLQCAATLAVMRRETGTWRWPVAAWLYMTTLGYLAALTINQLA